MNNKRILILLMFTLNISITLAQFIQKGKTLEYNGTNSKSIYTGLVQLKFMGSANAVNENGLFSLMFNQLNRGDVVKQFDVEIINKEYVLFNKKELSRWVLTSDIEMEVLLCKRTKIDNLIAIYSKNYIDNLNRKYNKALDELREELQETDADRERLKGEIEKLRTDYEMNISIIKSQSVAFAYVDETRLDSLELLRRKYILENNLSAAYEIGKKINYTGTAENYMSNIETFNREISTNVDNLLALIESLKIHIANIKQQVDEYRRYSKEQEQEIRTNLLTLVKINDFVLDLYSTKLRCTDQYMDELKNEYGQSLLQLAEFSDNDCKQHLLEKSAEMGNAMAMYQLGVLTSEQFNTSKQWFVKCLNATNDTNIRNMAEGELETFPDFMSIVQGDTIYCHILSEKDSEISICDFHPNDINKYNSMPLKIPSIIKHNKKKYYVKRIANNSFRNYCVHKWAGTQFAHNSKGYRQFNTVIFQEPLEIIGESSFAFSNIRNIVLPKSLRIIKKGAFYAFYQRIKRFDVPEGVEQIGEEILYHDYGESIDTISIKLPSTLMFLHKDAFNGALCVDELELNPLNKSFKLINGVLYSADTTSIYSSIIPYATKELFLPDKVSIDDIISFGSDNLQRFIISDKHFYYKTYENVLYTKDFSSIVSVPKGHNTLILHPCFKNFHSIDRSVYETTEEHRNVVIPRLLNPDTKYGLYIYYINDYIINREHSKINIFDDSISNPIDFDLAVSLAIDVLDNVEDSLLLNSKLLSKTGNKAINILYQKQLSRQSLLYGSTKENLREQAEVEMMLQNYHKAHELYTQTGLSENEISGIFFNWGHQYCLGNKVISQSFDHALDCFKYSISIYNNPLAAYFMGLLYENGDSVESNIDTAITWYKRSVEWGANFSDPSYKLGLLFYYGNKVQQDYNLAKQYFEVAARLKDADACNFLGIIYNKALSADRDIDKSIFFYEKAIEYGDKIFAPLNIGQIYYIEKAYKDYRKAYSYLKIAEENKNTDAMNMIAYMKALAQGTNHNLAEAIYYINKAITQFPNSIRYWDSKGEILLMMGRVEEANSVLHEMIKKDSSEVENLKFESNFLKAMQYDTKEEIFLKLLELGDSVNSPYLLGNLYFQKKELIKAKTYYEISSKHGNENAKVALLVVGIVMNNDNDVLKNSLIKIWQHTPIITSSPINEIWFTPDGGKIVGDSRTGNCYIWSSNGEELIYNRKYNQVYRKTIISPTGEYIIVDQGVNNTQIWKVDKDSLMYSISHFLFRPCFSNNGKLYLSCDKDGIGFYDKCALRLREVESGRILFTKKNHRYIDYVSFSPDDKFIIAIAGNEIYLWNSITGVLVQTYKYEYYEMDKALISPDNSKMICYDDECHFADLWDVNTGVEIGTIRHNAHINDVVIDCNSQYAVSASSDSTAVIWNISTGERLNTLSHEAAVKKLRISPDGKILATLCSNIIYLWNIETAAKVKFQMRHDSEISDFNFSPDGKIIVSSTINNVCRLWDVETGEEITSPYIPTGWIGTSSFSTDN